jgi:nicotinate-nucleotide adenylyltransferase
VKLGLMGGTFDPIHLGHLRAAESAREALGLTEVAFVPAGVPPHRPGPQTSSIDRFAMVCLATAAHPAFTASDIELQREGASYTVDTVAALLAARPDASVVLIVGSDAFAEISSWKDRERLFALCSVAVVLRPGTSTLPAWESVEMDGRVARVEGPGLPISASLVRQRVREGLSVRYLVPDAVADHIAKRGLYR